MDRLKKLIDNIKWYRVLKGSIRASKEFIEDGNTAIAKNELIRKYYDDMPPAMVLYLREDSDKWYEIISKFENIITLAKEKLKEIKWIN